MLLPFIEHNYSIAGKLKLCVICRQRIILASWSHPGMTKNPQKFPYRLVSQELRRLCRCLSRIPDLGIVIHPIAEDSDEVYHWKSRLCANRFYW